MTTSDDEGRTAVYPRSSGSDHAEGLVRIGEEATEQRNDALLDACLAAESASSEGPR